MQYAAQPYLFDYILNLGRKNITKKYFVCYIVTQVQKVLKQNFVLTLVNIKILKL